MPTDFFANNLWHRPGAGVEGMPAGMLSGQEGALLFHLARDYFSGFGEIIDAGAFLGSSSYCFARGIAENAKIGSKAGSIHAYDLFEVWREQDSTWQFMAAELRRIFNIEVGGFESTLPVYMSNLGAYGKYVRVHPGDITAKKWGGRPIELLFVDICKSLPLMTHVIRMFYPSLMPGISILIHQDYHHPLLPFIHVTQERLSEYFAIADEKVMDSAVFLLKNRIPDSVLAEVISYDFSVSQELKLMEKAIERMPNNNRHIKVAKAQLLRQRGFLKEARRCIDELKEMARQVHDDPRFEAYISFVEINLFKDEVKGMKKPDGFDEAAYLKANPDVQAACDLGVMDSGFHHWVQYGQREGRSMR